MTVVAGRGCILGSDGLILSQHSWDRKLAVAPESSRKVTGCPSIVPLSFREGTVAGRSPVIAPAVRAPEGWVSPTGAGHFPVLGDLVHGEK